MLGAFPVKEEGKFNLKTNDAFILRNIYGKYILMPVRTNYASNEPILFNETAVSVWETAKLGLKADAITKALCSQYGLEYGSSEAVSIDRFVSQMREMGLLIDDSGEE